MDPLRGLRRCRHHPSDSFDVALPARLLGAEGAAPGGREVVELGALALLGRPPVRLDPAALLHAMERGVERAVEDAERAAGSVADEAGDAVAVHRAPREGAE